MDSIQNLKPRDHRQLSSVMSEDFKIMMDNHPEAFECLIFKALECSTNPSDGLTEDFASALEKKEESISYASPVPSKAIILPEEGISFQTFGDGLDGDAALNENGMTTLLLREESVPNQSVVLWKEYTGKTDSEVKEVYMYILSSDTYGVAPVLGIKHHCISFDAPKELGDKHD